MGKLLKYKIKELILRKDLFVVLLACLTGPLLADTGKEIESFVEKGINSKEFQQVDELIKSLQEQGRKLSRQGKYEKALGCFRKALEQADKLYGKNSIAAAVCYTGIGSTYFRKGEKIKTADNFVIAGEIYKKSPGTLVKSHASIFLLIQAGFLYFEARYNRMAYQVLEQAEKNINLLSPEEKEKYLPRFNRYFGIACLREKEYKKAIPYLQKALAYENGNIFVNNDYLTEYHLFIGEALLETGECQKALIHLYESEKASKSIKTELGYKFYLCSCLARAHKYLNSNGKYLLFAKEAAKVSDLFVNSDSRKTIGKIILADANYRNGNKVQAESILKNAMNLAKNNNLSDELLSRIKNLDNLWQVESQNHNKAEIAYWEGRVAFDEDRLDDAFAYLQKALKYEKQKTNYDSKLLSKIYFWLGEITYQFGQWKKSVDFLGKAWKCTEKYNPDKEFMINLAEMLSAGYLMLKDYKLGLKFALISYKGYKELYGNETIEAGIHLSGIGVLYDKLGQKDKAIKSFEESIKILGKYKKEYPYPFNQAKNYLKKLQNSD